VVSFISPVARSEKAWVMGCNTQLPDGVSVQWAKSVAEGFHARFSATARRYRYIISNKPSRPAILSQGLTHQPFPLDVNLMNEAATCLLGEQDFTSFRAVACQSNTPMRNVHFVEVQRYGHWVVVDIQANAFLYHMVRNIVGSLMDVGTGKRSVAWFHELMAVRDRALASPTASPKGLYLVDVSYPEHFGLPATHIGPDFLLE
jgi:tRNA pseudouridine38-40 synthase